jgi:hypothetical protein
VVVSGRGDTAAVAANVQLQFNGDTGSNYDWQYFLAQNTSITGGATLTSTSAFIGQIPAATATAGVGGGAQATIHNYAGTALQKDGVFQANGKDGTGATNIVQWNGGFNWRSAAAINSIKVTLGAGGFVDGSIITVYGIGGTGSSANPNYVGPAGQDGEEGLEGPRGSVGPTGPCGPQGIAGFALDGNDGEDGQAVLATNLPGLTGATSTRTVAAPTAANSTANFTMQGLAGSITPRYSGNILVSIAGTVTAAGATTVNIGVIIQGSYGTGTAPTANAALTGTQAGALQQYTWPVAPTATADVHYGFNVIFLIPNAALGTALWLDLAAKAVTTASDAPLVNVVITAVEL